MGSCIAISKNYILDVTVNYFFPLLEKYRELEPACKTMGKNLTPYAECTARPIWYDHVMSAEIREHSAYLISDRKYQ